MASTFTPGQAFDYAKRFIKNMPLEQVAVQVCNDVSSYMWMAAPWRWSIGAFPNIALANSTQDYTVTLPVDFLYLETSYVTDQAGGIPKVFYIEPTLAAGGKQGTPSRIAVVSGTNGASGTVRFLPKPGPGSIPTGWTTISYYKKMAPVITAKNMNTAGTLVFDDEWSHVYVSGVLYYAYLFGDDQRAGGAQIDPATGKVTFTGQRGVWEANIMLMKQREKLAGVSAVTSEQKELV